MSEYPPPPPDQNKYDILKGSFWEALTLLSILLPIDTIMVGHDMRIAARSSKWRRLFTGVMIGATMPPALAVWQNFDALRGKDLFGGGSAEWTTLIDHLGISAVLLLLVTHIIGVIYACRLLHYQRQYLVSDIVGLSAEAEHRLMISLLGVMVGAALVLLAQQLS